jgi:hypothetical protein
MDDHNLSFNEIYPDDASQVINYNENSLRKYLLNKKRILSSESQEGYFSNFCNYLSQCCCFCFFL